MLRLSSDMFVQRTTFILGNEKNAGKTTVLNYVLDLLRKDSIELIYSSIGVDGESRDLLYGNPKPAVRVAPGEIVITVDSALRTSSASFALLDVYPILTPLGRLVSARVIRCGDVELIGPEHNGQLNEILSRMRNQSPLASILIDGALDRSSQLLAAAERETQVLFVARATAKNVSLLSRRLQGLDWAQRLPIWNGEQEAPAWFEFPGALTARKLSCIPPGTKLVVIDGPESLFLEERVIAKMPWTLALKTRCELLALVVRLEGLNRSEILPSIPHGLRDKLIWNPWERCDEVC